MCGINRWPYHYDNFKILILNKIFYLWLGLWTFDLLCRQSWNVSCWFFCLTPLTQCYGGKKDVVFTLKNGRKAKHISQFWQGLQSKALSEGIVFLTVERMWWWESGTIWRDTLVHVTKAFILTTHQALNYRHKTLLSLRYVLANSLFFSDRSWKNYQTQLSLNLKLHSFE